MPTHQAMKHTAQLLFVFGIVCLHSVGASQINPELEPKSDNKFFKKDYPDDQRPEPIHKFEHPYPTVQDSDRYDHDYVKDENDDGGYWKAQMEYDKLKNRVAKERAEHKAAVAKEAEERKEMEDAIAAEKKAEAEANIANENEDEAASKRKNADAVHGNVKDNMDEATQDVEKEVRDLEDCKKQLEEAKAKLKLLLAELEAAEKLKAKRDASEEAAEKDMTAAQKTLDELWQIYLKQKKEYEDAESKIEKQRQDVKEEEIRLEKAKVKLQKRRRADPDGGVYEVHAGARYANPLGSAALLLVASATCLL